MNEKDKSNWVTVGDTMSEMADALQRLVHMLPTTNLHCNIAVSGMTLIEQRALKTAQACYDYHDACQRRNADSPAREGSTK